RSLPLVGATVLLTAAAVVVAAGPAGLAANSTAQRAAPPQGDRQATKEKDNRQGVGAPTTRQLARAHALDARAPWNRLGPPAVLAPPGTRLPPGLGADPGQAARSAAAANRAVLGLPPKGAAALEVLTVAPMGKGAAVIFRQRFGTLPAGRDGMLSVGVRGG